MKGHLTKTVLYRMLLRGSLCVALLGILGMALGLLLGGDLLDGLAGGPAENTPLESFLVYGGFWTTFSALFVAAAIGLSFVIKVAVTARSKNLSWPKLLLNYMLGLILIGALGFAFVVLFKG